MEVSQVSSIGSFPLLIISGDIFGAFDLDPVAHHRSEAFTHCVFFGPANW